MRELPKNSFLLELITKLAPDPQKVAEYIRLIRAENPELDTLQLSDFVGDKIVWMYATQGAALALPGAIPGLGTIVQLATEAGTATVDIALMVRNQTYLVFALGSVFGLHGRETLTQDTLICLGLWTNALVLTKQGAIRIGSKIAQANFKKRFPAEILKRINRKVGTTVLTKYGTKRGGVAVGKMIPFGVGVLIGGGFNYLTMKAFKRHTVRYFSTKRPAL
jgi:hypothetical protein